MKKKLDGPIVMDAPNSASSEKEGPQDWEIEDAVKTMQKAHKIQKDPKMMKHVHKHIGKQISSLKDLKALASQKAMDEANEQED